MGLRKASAERFDREAIAIAGELGAQRDEYDTLDYYVITTRAGRLNLRPSTRPILGKRQLGLFTVFCRFDDVSRARSLLGRDSGLNPHSGKYNFHMTGSDDGVDDALAAFKAHLQRAL
jgi:hypothetical protein